MKQVTCKSGLKGWQGHLREVYASFCEFEGYSIMYGLHARLGYATPLKAWHDNPEIQGSVNPSDFRRVLKRYPFQPHTAGSRQSFLDAARAAFA
jgi:hypothetical protein